MRIVVGFASVILLSLSVVVSAQAPDAFKDLPRGHWAYDACDLLAESNVIWGYPKKYFAGKRFLMRYEFAMAVERALSGSPSRKQNEEPVSRYQPYFSTATIAERIPTQDVGTLLQLIDEFHDELLSLGVSFSRATDHYDIPLERKMELLLDHWEAAESTGTTSIPALRPVIRGAKIPRESGPLDIYDRPFYRTLSEDPAFRYVGKTVPKTHVIVISRDTLSELLPLRLLPNSPLPSCRLQVSLFTYRGPAGTERPLYR
jgi:hypothetical protein